MTGSSSPRLVSFALFVGIAFLSSLASAKSRSNCECFRPFEPGREALLVDPWAVPSHRERSSEEIVDPWKDRVVPERSETSLVVDPWLIDPWAR